MPTKVLFLGIDAGDKFLVQNWAADGTLPTFRSLLANGFVGDTISLRGFFVGATWPSFFTGLTPANHGFHSLVQLNQGTYEFYRCTAGNSVKGDPFWHFLSKAGKRVAILDVPLSGITPQLNGIQIVEWGSHDANYGYSTWPPHLKWEVWARFGRHPLRTSCDSIGRTPQDFRAFRDLLIKGVRKKTRLTKHFLQKGDWDFFAQVFTEAHCAGHQCYHLHLHDPDHPYHEGETGALTFDPICDVYKAIDTSLSEILHEVDRDTVVFVLLSHRMVHFYGANFLLPEILRRLQLAKLSSTETALDEYNLSTQINAYLKWLSQNTSPRTKDALKQIIHYPYNLIIDYYSRLSPIKSKIDPNRSSVFIMFNGNPVSGLRVNLCGREPNGTVNPGRGMDSFCNGLTSELMKIVEYESRKPIVKGVLRTAELYQGEYLDCLPDLLVEWDDEIMLESESSGNSKGRGLRIFSEKIGIIEGVNTYCRTGDHRPEGLFIALGPHVKAGRLDRTVSIMDFAPTFCRLLGAELAHVDGQPIREIF
jgi:predicted AlkP superfamily phosphohydrolase/phosphomutase